jgi:hypothetical protein
MKTGQEIEDDVYSLIKNSANKPAVSGDVYKFGLRPRDSKQEDIVVKFITGLSNQIQTGRVLIQVYIPDIQTNKSGVLVKNITRCKEMEEAIMNWFNSLKGLDYYFKLASTIQTFPDEEINQHFVSVRLDFKFLTT